MNTKRIKRKGLTGKAMHRHLLKPSQSIVMWIIVLLAPVLSMPAWSTSAKLPYFSATYDATIKGISVKATREYRPLENNLEELHFEATSLFAGLSERSHFSWEEGQIKPVRFSYKRSVLGKQQQKTLTFDWANDKIVSTDQDSSFLIDNTSKALDRLSFQLQLQYDLLRAGSDDIYRVADKDKIKQYRFEIIGEEVLDTKMGKIKTRKIKVIRENKSRVTYLWLASELNNLLTRLEQFKNDKKEFGLQITSAIMNGEKVNGEKVSEL
jgi:hypothetical protein